uniref:BPI1 domain-containing protein n=1 Tax=Panagrellus redivivus TaxID=6233 RepID=A0A7E4WDN9_PANRE
MPPFCVLLLLGSLFACGVAYPNIPLRVLQQQLQADALEHLPGIVFRVNPNIDSVINDEKTRHYLAKSLKTTAFDNFSFKVLQMNLSIDNLGIEHVDISDIRVTPISRHSYKISIESSSVHIAGSYRGIYRTIREGNVNADLTGISVTATVSLPLTAKKTDSVSILDCSTNIDDAKVAFEPALIEQANEKLAQLLRTYVEGRICAGIDVFFRGDKLAGILHVMPLTLKTDTMKTKMNSGLVLRPVIDDGSLFVALDGSFGDGVDRERVQIEKMDTDANIYAYMSDFVLNSYLRERTHEKKLKLKLNPAFTSLLATNCEEDGNCIGSFIDSRTFAEDYNSPEVIVAFGTPPKVDFTEAGARLTLNVTAELSYNEITERKNVLSVSTILTVLIKKFDLSVENRETELQLDLDLEKMDLLGVNVNMPVADGSIFGEVVEKVLVMENKAVIEDLIMTNIPRLMPVYMSNKLHVNAIRGFFRPNTLVLSANVTPKTLKYFL